MSQNLKKENCTGKCYPKCPIHNILQRRIGNWIITDKNTIENMARYLQKERCPENSKMDITHISLPNINS